MGDKQITVNCVAPGGIKTDMYHKVCREYIPGGEKLNDDQVDEVRPFNFHGQIPEADLNSTLPHGHHCTESAFQSMSRVWFVSLLARMANGSMERFWVLTALLVCKMSVTLHDFLHNYKFIIGLQATNSRMKCAVQ